jgi:hypothetical protein
VAGGACRVAGQHAGRWKGACRAVERCMPGGGKAVRHAARREGGGACRVAGRRCGMPGGGEAVRHAGVSRG